MRDYISEHTMCLMLSTLTDAEFFFVATLTNNFYMPLIVFFLFINLILNCSISLMLFQFLFKHQQSISMLKLINFIFMNHLD